MVEPTCTESGIETYTCAVCGESETRGLAALGHDYVETVIAPSCVDQGYSLYTCSRCAESYKDTYTDPHCPGISFADMPAVGDRAHDAIDWAITTGVTVGTSGTTFSPDKVCTRAEVVTFLWREAGSPEPATNSCGFTDVKDGFYYEKAIIWAAEKGIAKGTSESTFSPDKACTRAEVVTFLWRANGSPEVNNTCKFTDVEPGAYYERAVIWAAQEGITVGTAATIFGVGGACTRAQIVTFLYRNQEMQ